LLWRRAYFSQMEFDRTAADGSCPEDGRRGRRGAALLLICFILLLEGYAGLAGEIYPKRPRATPYYYNESGLAEMDQSCRACLRRARARTGVEFVTAIVESIPGTMMLGDYAAGLFDAWKIGSRTEGRGVLILFVEADRTLKIEVSYDLEPYLTDAYCSSFQPTIKSYYAGLYFGDVFDSIVENLERRILLQITDEDPEWLDAPAIDAAVLKASETFLSGGGGVIEDDYYYEKDAKLAFIRPLPPERMREFDADRDMAKVVERYFQSLREGINYPFLGLLTEGSQLMRLEYPESPHFYRSRWEDCRGGLPYELKVKGDLAAVRFSRDCSFPVFLRQTPEGLWKIDAARAWVSSWQDFAGNRSGPLYRDHPWMFAFPEYKPEASLCKVPDVVPMTVSLKDEIGRLDRAIRLAPDESANYFNLADIFCWECMWLVTAIDLVEKGLELDPGNVPYRWLAIDMRYRFPSPEPNARHFEMLLALEPGNADALYGYSRHCWQFTMDHRKAVRLLRRAREAEERETGGAERYRWMLAAYKDNYWEQVAVDWGRVRQAWNYIWIFWFS
jgi:hypothetical protein